MELSDRKIIYSETDSHVVPPSDTIRRAEGILQKIGVEKVEQIDPKYTDGVPVFRLNESPIKARCHRAIHRWFSPPSLLGRESYGKGMSVDQSKASAMMEAVERYCGQRFPHNRVVHASYEEVQGHAVDPSKFRFPNLLPPKCENCRARDVMCFRDIASVCDEWSWGFSLVNKEQVLVPSALVYYPYLSDDGRSFMFNDTGGLASGNTLEDAILHGIAEAVERNMLHYALNLGNLNKMPLINFRQTKNQYIRKFIGEALPPEKVFAFLLRNGNHGLDIPTITAFICHREGGRGLIFGGSGAHLNPEVALLRALTEMEQQRVREKCFVESNPNSLVSFNNVRLEDTVSIGEISDQSTGNIKKDIELYSDKLSKNGMDIIAVNLTHPEIGIPVIRVIIPELISYSGLPFKISLLTDIMRSFGHEEEWEEIEEFF